MGRLFLSGQTTCALLLGAGLLLRAQALLRPPDGAEQQGSRDDRAAPESERAQKSEMSFDERPLHQRVAQKPNGRVLREGRQPGSTTARHEQSSSHLRKGLAHHGRRLQGKRCGASLAERKDGFRCG